MSKLNNGDKLDRSRKWTENEHELFVIILSNEETKFAINLKKLDSKKRCNNEKGKKARTKNK